MYVHQNNDQAQMAALSVKRYLLQSIFGMQLEKSMSRDELIIINLWKEKSVVYTQMNLIYINKN